MATLVQARLSLLSQRCLSLASVKRDSIHDIEPSIYRRCIAPSYDNIPASPEATHSSHNIVDRTRTRWRLANHNSCTCNVSIVDSRSLITVTNTYHNVDPTNAHKRGHVYHIDDRKFNNDSYTCKKLLNHSQQYQKSYLYHNYPHHHHKRGYHEDDQAPRFTRLKPLLATLGLVGLFKNKDADSVEEDRTKLSDPEKIKKMKPIELLIAKGVLSMCDQNYAGANEFFHNALHIAQDEGDDERENQILNLLAANFFESGDFENAEKLFIDLMKRMIATGLDTTAPPILELSLKLASIYSRNPAAHQKALKGYKFVINSLLMNLDDVLNQEGDLNVDELSEEKRDELALLGWSYDWFAKHLLTANDYNGAADMLQRALKISSQVLGPLHDQTLILLNDVGTTLAMNGSPEEGRRFIKKAVECAIKSQSKELASFYVNLGLVNLKLLKLHEAKRYCEYSLELASKNREHHNSHEVIELSRSCLNEVERLLEVEDK